MQMRLGGQWCYLLLVRNTNLQKKNHVAEAVHRYAITIAIVLDFELSALPNTRVKQDQSYISTILSLF